MASLKDLRNRISSVKATQKITKAMQMVAAAKLRRAQEAAEAGRPYAERMDTVLANLMKRVNSQEDASPLLVGTGKDDVHLLVAATAERGLCGGFNSNISRLVRQKARSLLAGKKEVKILCVGRKGFDSLKNEFGSKIIDTIELKGIKNIGFSHAQEIAARILDLLEEEAFDICTLFFSEFKSVMTQRPRPLQLIPVSRTEDTEETAQDSSGVQSAYEYEPDEDEILKDLLPRNVATQIFRALLENAASEQGARMTAMDSATRNAGDMIDKLTLNYNRSRQAQITKELIEIVSGAEAL